MLMLFLLGIGMKRPYRGENKFLQIKNEGIGGLLWFRIKHEERFFNLFWSNKENGI